MNGVYSKLQWHILHKIVMHIHERHHEVVYMNYTHVKEISMMI